MTPLKALHCLHMALARGEPDSRLRREYLEHICIELQPEEWGTLWREIGHGTPASTEESSVVHVYGIKVRLIQRYKPLAFDAGSV